MDKYNGNGRKMTITQNNEQLQLMLDEVKRIRESLAELSASAQSITEAIRGVLEEDTTGPGFEDAYRAIHEDL